MCQALCQVLGMDIATNKALALRKLTFFYGEEGEKLQVNK